MELLFAKFGFLPHFLQRMKNINNADQSTQYFHNRKLKEITCSKKECHLD